MKDELRPTYPTIFVLNFLIFVFAWMTELLLLVSHAFLGRLPGNNPVAHGVLLSVALGSWLFGRLVGRRQFARDAHPGGRMHLTLRQSVIVTLFVISYSIFVEWALGVFV